MSIFLSADDVICRAKKQSTQEWIYGYYIQRNNKPYIAEVDERDIIDVNNDTSIIKVHPVFNFSVCLYTFETDINGKDIYEGDFLKTTIGSNSPFQTELITMVVFDNGTFYAGGIIEIENNLFKYCQVVGNKNDNPEILDLIPVELEED